MSSSVATIANMLKAKATTEKEKELTKELFRQDIFKRLILIQSWIKRLKIPLLFRMADKNRDGMLDLEEYAIMFNKKGLKLSREEIKEVFEREWLS